MARSNMVTTASPRSGGTYGPLAYRRQRRSRRAGVLLSAVLMSVGLTAAPSSANARPGLVEPDGRVSGTGSSPTVTGATPADRAFDLERRMRDRLGRHFAGAWLAKTGEPMAAVTKGGDLVAVTAAGARPVLVDHSERVLRSAQARIDRRANHAPRSIVAWYVDPPTNRLVIESLPGQEPGAARFASAAGVPASLIRFVTTPEHPRHLSDFFDVRGGQWILGRGGVCAVGLTVAGGFITAAHCVGPPGEGVTAANGHLLGTVMGVSAADSDFAFVRTDGWTPEPEVVGPLKPFGLLTDVIGSAEFPVGAYACRSGPSTGVVCGNILARGVTVQFADGRMHNDMVTTDTCANAGDSGGPLLARGQAQGLLSGGRSSAPCRSYFQPVNEALSALGVTLLTTAVPPRPVTVTLAGRHVGGCIAVNGFEPPVRQAGHCRREFDQQWMFKPSATGAYQVISATTGMCLDVAGASLDNGALVNQFPCHGGTNQRWRLTIASDGAETLTAEHSGKCLDVPNSNRDAGVAVQQFTCHGGPNQLWSPQTFTSFTVLHTGKCLEVAGASLDDDAAVVQAPCTGAFNQLWQPRPAVRDFSGYVAAHSFKCLATPPASFIVVQLACDPVRGSQSWRFELIGQGGSGQLDVGLCLAIPDASSDDGAPSRIELCDGGLDQRFRMGTYPPPLS
jgi:streptogrisin C